MPTTGGKMTDAAISRIFDQASKLQAQESEKPVTMTLERKFRNNASNQDSDFTKEMREMLRPAVNDALAALIDVVRTSKNAQAKTAAARQILRIAYSVKLLDADSFKEMVDGLSEIGSLEDAMGRED